MNTGKIIPIAYPDTFVKYSEVGFQKNILSSIGLGRDGYVKAGHALLLLIENNTGNIQYFDFGRYITPPGHGRVRSAITDVELVIPFKAHINKTGNIENIDQILLWLEAHPEKTHGEGRLVASVCHQVNYDKAYNFILKLQSEGSVPYKTFGNIGSNCSRLVTDTLIHSSTNRKIVSSLKRISKFTPSPLGNVQKGAHGGSIYNVFKGKVSAYNNSVLKENLTNYFDGKIPNNTSVELPKRVDNKHLLGGIGASAYFELKQANDVYQIIRYTVKLVKDFEGIFESSKFGFRIDEDYEFVYDSNCSYCHIKQNGTIYRFNLINSERST